MNNVNNPYATYSTDAAPKLHMDISDQFKAHQKEELEQKAPKILPHPAEKPLIEITSEMYINLMKMRDIINKTEAEPKRNKEATKQILSIIDEIGRKITELYVPIDKLYL
jgi:hypothetical protein